MQKKSRLVVIIFSSLLVLLAPIVPANLNVAASAADSAFGTAYVTLNAYSGTAGALAVSGGGFDPGSQVAVYLGSGSVPADVALVPVAADSSFGPVVVNVPVGSAQGAQVISAVGVGGLSDGVRVNNSYYVTPFQASVVVTAAAHTPGTAVTVSGSGYAPGETVNLALGTATATATADAAGAFDSASLIVPRVAPGIQQLTAVGAASTAQAVDYFYIDAFYPSTYPSAYFLLPGQTLSFSGQGYAPGETVDVSEVNGAVLSSFVVPTPANFDLVGGIVIPNAWANTSRNLQLVGRETGGTSSLTVSVGQFNPNVSPTDYYLTPGSATTFTASGFAPSELVDEYVGKDTTPVATIATDEFGAFALAGSFTAPYAGATSADFRFVGESSSATATASISVGTLSSQIQPSDYFVHAGQAETVTASGFAPGETVTVTGAGGVTASAVADLTGAATVGPVTVPFGTTESYLLTATGSLSAQTATVAVSIGGYTPSAGASSYYLLPGNELDLTGAGFAPGEVVDVTQGLTAVSTATADVDGNVVVAPITVGYTATGPQSYTLTGESSTAVASVSLTVGTYFASAAADNYYARPGTTVNVSGSGFAAGEAVTVDAGGVQTATAADALGNTPLVAVIVPYPVGNQTSAAITLTGGLTGVVAKTSITLAPFTPSITPSAYYATPGTPVSFAGTGFAPGETVTAHLGKSVIGTAVADTDGAVAIDGGTLKASGADYSFTGALSGASVSSSVSLAQFYAGVAIDNYYGAAGTAITVSGTGFAASETVTVKFGDTDLGTANTDATGAFSLAGVVPAGTGGTKSVTASGSASGATATTSYTQADA